MVAQRWWHREREHPAGGGTLGADPPVPACLLLAGRVVRRGDGQTMRRAGNQQLVESRGNPGTPAHTHTQSEGQCPHQQPCGLARTEARPRPREEGADTRFCAGVVFCRAACRPYFMNKKFKWVELSSKAACSYQTQHAPQPLTVAPYSQPCPCVLVHLQEGALISIMLQRLERIGQASTRSRAARSSAHHALRPRGALRRGPDPSRPHQRRAARTARERARIPARPLHPLSRVRAAIAVRLPTRASLRADSFR